MRSSKVSGSNIVPGVHCLVHDVNIHLLTIEFSRLIIGGLSCRQTIELYKIPEVISWLSARPIDCTDRHTVIF